MKFIVFSDIHGNHLALEKMLKKTADLNVDFYIHLGDVFGYFYNQKKVIDIFRNLNVINIKGNHDEYFISLKHNIGDVKMLNNNYGTSYQMNFESLGNTDIDYISNLSDRYEIKYKDYKIFFCHGSPFDLLNGRVYPDSNEFFRFNELEYDFIFMGHTHYQFIRESEDKIIVNPGSLGLPRDGKGFSFVYCDLKNQTFQFDNVYLTSDEIKTLFLNSKDFKLHEKIQNILSKKGF
jgi:putative phosphoesterase